jgi:hypothetical protein
MQVRPDGLRTVGRTPESRPAVLSQSVWRHEEGAAVGGAFTGTVGAARPAMLAQAPAPAGTGAAATGGRPGGERAAAHPDGDEPGGHVGQGHHDQRGGPGGGAGDVVRDAEGGDGRAGWSLTVLAGSGGYDHAVAVLIQPSKGDIIVIGQSVNSAGVADLALARYLG